MFAPHLLPFGNKKNGKHEEKKIKESNKIKKKTIEDLFKNERGLLINKVKAGGSGTLNDGNTAGRFFLLSIIF